MCVPLAGKNQKPVRTALFAIKRHLASRLVANSTDFLTHEPGSLRLGIARKADRVRKALLRHFQMGLHGQPPVGRHGFAFRALGILLHFLQMIDRSKKEVFKSRTEVLAHGMKRTAGDFRLCG